LCVPFVRLPSRPLNTRALKPQSPPSPPPPPPPPRPLFRSEREYERAMDDLVGAFGGPDTRWDKLVDSDTGSYYWCVVFFSLVLWV